MNGPVAPRRGVEGFVADLAAQGCDPVVEAGVVKYRVTAVSGKHAGEVIETGVSVAELQHWPTTPAHWIHLPVHFQFAKTNADTNGCTPEWRRHSRNPGPWRLDRDPILIWLAHLRAVIGEAT